MHKQATARRARPGWTVGEEMQPAGRENRIESIVIPTDFSMADNQLLHRAVLLAQLFDTKITLLHVIDTNDPRWATYCGCATDFMRQLKTEAERQMNELRMWFGTRAAEIRALTVEGLPYQEILNLLTASSLLIMRKPVAKAFWKLFSKRTAQRVLDEAQCALMVCPN